MKQQSELELNFTEFAWECEFSNRLSADTLRGYKEVFSLFLELVPEVREIQFLIPEMLVEFFKRLQIRQRKVGKHTFKIGVKTSTIKTYWSKLNAFFVWLVSKGKLEKNPLNSLKCPNPVYEDIRTLEEIDVRKIYAAIALHSRNNLILRRDITMVSILLFCGLRLGEFISLNVTDVDFQRQILSVSGYTSKSKRVRYIPLHTTLRHHLKEYFLERYKRGYKTNKLIVSFNTDKGLSKHGLKHWVKTLSKKSGVKFHLHQFRHSFATNLAKNDVNVVKIQKLLGHRSLIMTMSYMRSLGVEDLRNSIDRLSI